MDLSREKEAFERIEHGERLLAIIIYDAYRTDGIRFFTPDDLSQQLAFMSHPAGKVIPPHVHNPVPRSVTSTQETLFVKSGRIRVDLYDDDGHLLAERLLSAGDTILFVSGGHGLEIIQDARIVEVKQGPYAGDEDKTVFTPSSPTSPRER